jgi:hypothetical protein
MDRQSTAIMRTKQTVLFLVIFCLTGGIFAAEKDTAEYNFTFQPMGDDNKVQVTQRFSALKKNTLRMDFTFHGKSGNIKYTGNCSGPVIETPPAGLSVCRAEIMKLGTYEVLKVFTGGECCTEAYTVLAYDPKNRKVEHFDYSQSVDYPEVKPAQINENRFVIPLHENDHRGLPDTRYYYGLVIEFSEKGTKMNRLDELKGNNIDQEWCKYLAEIQMSAIRTSIEQIPVPDDNEISGKLNVIKRQRLQNYLDDIGKSCGQEK